MFWRVIVLDLVNATWHTQDSVQRRDWSFGQRMMSEQFPRRFLIRTFFFELFNGFFFVRMVWWGMMRETKDVPFNLYARVVGEGPRGNWMEFMANIIVGQQDRVGYPLSELFDCLGILTYLPKNTKQTIIAWGCWSIKSTVTYNTCNTFDVKLLKYEPSHAIYMTFVTFINSSRRESVREQRG